MGEGKLMNGKVKGEIKNREREKGKKKPQKQTAGTFASTGYGHRGCSLSCENKFQVTTLYYYKERMCDCVFSTCTCSCPYGWTGNSGTETFLSSESEKSFMTRFVRSSSESGKKKE